MAFLGFEAPGMAPPAALPDAAMAPQGITTLRFGNAGYATRPGEVPASTLYEPRLLGDVSIAQSATNMLGLGGVVALTAGELRLDNADGALAEMVRYGTADGRPLRLRALPVLAPAASDFGQPFVAAGLAFAGLVRGVHGAEGQAARLAFGDLTERLNAPLQPTRYGGAGGTDGTADLAGKPKPVCLGRAFNVPAVFLGNVDIGDGLLATYQVHWRAVQGVDAVRMRGVPQTLVAGAPTVGQARAWPGLGLFQLGSAPDGTVRADVQGDAVGGYVSSTAGILRRLLSSLGPQLVDADFDADAFAFADGDLGGEVGWYAGAEPVTAMQAAERIVAGCGAVLAGGRAGTLRLFDPLARAAAQFSLAGAQVLALKPVDLPAALRPLPIATAVAWRPNWGPISDAAGAVAATARQSYASAASGPARVVGAATSARQAVQRELALAGLYWDQADALARAAAWQAWIEGGPLLIEATTDQYLGQMESGTIGRLAYPAYGLGNGALVVVLGWRELLGARRLTMTLATLPE